MAIGTHEDLVNAISELRTDLGQYSTHTVVGWVGTILVRGFVDAIRDFDLQSPFRQSYFILGLLTSTSDPILARELDKAALKSVIRRVNDIYDYYRDLIVRTDVDAEAPDPDRAKAVALFTFVHYFYAFRLQISIEQQDKRIIDFFGPFADQIERTVGLSIPHLIDIVQTISDGVSTRFDLWRSSCREYQNKHRTENLPDALVALSDEPFMIRRSDLTSRFSASDVDTFWTNFVSVRGSNRDFNYPTDNNLAEDRPLFELEHGVAYMPAGNPLRLAVFSQLSKILIDGPLQARFFRHRDKLLEQQTESAFRRFFGDDAQYYAAAYETSLSQFEHDLIIHWSDTLFVVEAKAASLKEPSPQCFTLVC